MSLFNFGNKQKLHTQLIGNTTGKEMFKVDEYNKVKQTTILLSFMTFGIFTLFYFCFGFIPNKIKGFLFIIVFIFLVWGYFNVKNQMRLKEKLYN